VGDALKSRVGFILAGTGTGGAERYLLRVLARVGQDLEPVLFVRGAKRGDLHGEFVRCGAEVVYFRLGYLDPRGVFRLIKLLRSKNLRSLVDFSGIFSGISLWAAKRAGIQERIVFHRRSSHAFKPTWRSLLYARMSTQLTEHVATRILANSHAALQQFHPRLLDSDKRLEVISNFIDPKEVQPKRSRMAVREELNIPQEAFVLLHTGRLDPAKDHPTLLAAAMNVMKNNERVVCVCAGPGTETLIVDDTTESLQLRERFRFLGTRSDVPDLLHASDLFVFPSITEGQPNALLEAIISGLPVVTTDIEAIKEVIPKKSHVHLVPARDVKKLSESILACIATKEERDSRRYIRHVRQLADPDQILSRLLPVLAGEKNA